MGDKEHQNNNRHWPFNTQLAKTIYILKNGKGFETNKVTHGVSNKKG